MFIDYKKHFRETAKSCGINSHCRPEKLNFEIDPCMRDRINAAYCNFDRFAF